MQCEGISGWKIHEDLLKFDEDGTLERFGHEVSNHLFCGTVLHGEVTMGNAVGDEKVAHIEVSCALWAQQFAILFKEDGDVVVLVEDSLIQIETLSM